MRNKPKNSLAIVTGANSPFYLSLRDNLLSSIVRYDKDANIYVWDLGLSEEERQEIKKLFPQVRLLRFDYDLYPEHFKLRYQTNAFKSACIWETMKITSAQNVFWLDAGCAIKDKLKAVRILLRWHGFYSPFSSTTIQALTVPSVTNSFLIPTFDYIANKRMLSGGIVGVNKRNFKGVQIIREWHQLTLDKRMIAPAGSNRENHRQDQSLLSLVYYSRKKRLPILQRRYYEFMVHLNKG